MSRNGSGTYSAPAGQPAVADVPIDPAVHNTLVSDIGTEITDSLSRSGKGAMLAALKVVDGTVSAPGIAFASELGSGLYRPGAGDVRIAILGALVQKITAAGLDVTGKMAATGAVSGTTGTFSGAVSGTTGTFSAGLGDDTSHGNRGNGSLHTAATGAAAGFMAAADKTKLDDATSAATASKLVIRDSNGRAKVADPSASDDIATKGYVDASSASTVSMAAGWSASTNSVLKSGAVVTVALVATAAGGASWLTIGTLPVGHRPGRSNFFFGVTTDATANPVAARFEINTDGTITAGLHDNGTYLASMFAIGVGDEVNLTATFIAA